MKKVKEGLTFKEIFGELKFLYSEPDDYGGHYQITAEIPEEIIEKGEDAVLKYANKKINKAKKEWARRKSIEDNIRRNNIPIKTKYKDGTLLEGRIIEAVTEHVKVELDKPFKSQGKMRFGVYAGMAGEHVFNENYEISEDGYDAAYDALRQAYKKILDQPKKDLVEKLNKKALKIK